MKKVFLGLCLFFSVFYGAYAEYEIAFDLSKDEVILGESFEATITLKNYGDIVISSMDIPGLEKFQQLGKSQVSEVLSDEGLVTTETKITIILASTETGEFTLGPVKVELGKDSEVIGESKAIKVIGTNPTQSGSVNTDGIDTSEEEEDKGGLYGLKQTENKFFYNSTFFLLIGLALFIAIFYYLLSKYLLSLTKTPVRAVPQIEQKAPLGYEYLIEKLNKLKSKLKDMDRSDFYASINEIIREYLEQKGVNNAGKMTSSELLQSKNKQNEEVFEILSDTYFAEFKDIKEENKKREMYIDAFLKILKK